MNFAHNRIISPSEIDNSKYRCEYVVIGSGAGGSVAAMELSEAGKDVIILEEGLYFDSSDFKNDISDMTKASWRNSGVTPFWGKPPIGFAEGRCVGGSTVINGGLIWRTPEHILDLWKKDFGFSGNKFIQTPNIDNLVKNSILLKNFHVDPTCAPTRAALLTGRYSNRTGVWHTVQGRNMLREREITLADVLKENGYETGLFGKWHLGDNYPYRPVDRGFNHCIMHHAGGVGQAPDYWGNDYFDDTYNANGVFERFDGFCTDIWFDEAIKFIKSNKKKGEILDLSGNVLSFHDGIQNFTVGQRRGLGIANDEPLYVVAVSYTHLTLPTNREV